MCLATPKYLNDVRLAENSFDIAKLAPFSKKKASFFLQLNSWRFFFLRRLQLSKNILVDKDQVLIWQAINSFCFKLHSSIHPSLVVGAADLSILILILQSMHIILKLTKHQITNGRHAYALLNTFTKMALVTNTLIQCYAPKKQKISMLGNRFMQNNLIRIIWMCTKKVINKNVPSVFFENMILPVKHYNTTLMYVYILLPFPNTYVMCV